MVAEREQLPEFLLAPRGGEGMDLAAEILAAQACLVHGTRAHAPERSPPRAREQGKDRPGRKALESEQDLRARGALHAVKDGGVGREPGFVKHEAGRRDRGIRRQKKIEAVHLSVPARRVRKRELPRSSRAGRSG